MYIYMYMQRFHIYEYKFMCICVYKDVNLHVYMYIKIYPVGCARNRHQAIGEVRTRRRSILKVAIPS